LKRKKKKEEDAANETEEQTEANHDKIDLFGDIPGWELGWVKAYRVNAAGQVHTHLTV
jgi:hypothetical protein